MVKYNDGSSTTCKTCEMFSTKNTRASNKIN